MIASQDYGWSQLAARAGLAWPEATDWAMKLAVEAGIKAWEPLVWSVDDVRRIGTLAQGYGLGMPSIFLTGPLHDSDAAASTLRDFSQIVRAAVEFGCARVLVYPSPLPEGAEQDKSDLQLATQAGALESLARALAPLGASLCYHPEDGEMRQAAREFHHMLQATDPALVRLCLDPDTVWRGAGFSQIALLDIIRLYGARVDSVHLRQSQDRIWTEVLGPGDLDYPKLMTALAAQGARPDLVIEHAYEAATTVSLTPVAAHRQSLAFVTGKLMPRLRA